MDGGDRFMLCSDETGYASTRDWERIYGWRCTSLGGFLEGTVQSRGVGSEENHTYLSEFIHNNNFWAPWPQKNNWIAFPRIISLSHRIQQCYVDWRFFSDSWITPRYLRFDYNSIAKIIKESLTDRTTHRRDMITNVASTRHYNTFKP
jgi:hypothetical protein